MVDLGAVLDEEALDAGELVFLRGQHDDVERLVPDDLQHRSGNRGRIEARSDFGKQGEAWAMDGQAVPVLGKRQVTQRFFDEVAHQVRLLFESANRDAESWIKALMAPMETQIREHQIQLKRRLESIKRIHQATETLEERINELLHVENQLTSQIRAIESAAQAVQHILNRRLGQQALRDAA